jgi:hypothetical protein
MIMVWLLTVFAAMPFAQPSDHGINMPLQAFG